MKRLLSSLAIFATLLSAVPVRAASLSAGDLIKASGPAVYYYAEDGKRYVFPTEKTYLSWYTNFGTVKTVTDSELAAITIGGNVTYRPGVRLVKVTTDPRVYAVHGRQLRWVMSEAVAKAIFGDDWAKQVDDIPDAFFVNYTIGAEIDNAADFAPSDIRATYASIQATITTPAPAPAPTPTPTPTPSPTAATVSLSTDRTSAQANESIYVLGETSYTGTIEKFELFADDGLLNTCTAKTCSGTWRVPTAGVKTSYAFRARLTMSGGQFTESSVIVPIVLNPVHSSVVMTVDRTVIRSGQIPYLRARVTAGLSSNRTEIFLDGTSVKACTSTPNDCLYDDYVFGALSTTHTAYALIRTSANLYYKSAEVTFTIGDNDAPRITLVPDRNEIFVNESLNVTLTAQDDDGVGQIEIRKDGALLKSCTGAAPCTANTGPWNVSAGTVLTFTGTATDLKGTTSTAQTSVTVR